MRVVIVGPAALGQWNDVRRFLDLMGPQDEVIHSAGDGIGFKVDYVAKRRKGFERKRLPRIEVQIPEVGRYDRAQAYEQNALQLLHVRMPDVVVFVGDGLDDEVRPVMKLLGLDGPAGVSAYPRIKCMALDEFLRERAIR